MAEEKPTILVVEDGQLRNGYEAMLSDQYTVIAARDPDEASEKMKGKKIDVVLTDNEMPPVNKSPDDKTEDNQGLNFIQTLRGQGYTGPIIMNTSNMRQMLQDALAKLNVIIASDKKLTLTNVHSAVTNALGAPAQDADGQLRVRRGGGGSVGSP